MTAGPALPSVRAVTLPRRAFGLFALVAVLAAGLLPCEPLPFSDIERDWMERLALGAAEAGEPEVWMQTQCPCGCLQRPQAAGVPLSAGWAVPHPRPAPPVPSPFALALAPLVVRAPRTPVLLPDPPPLVPVDVSLRSA